MLFLGGGRCFIPNFLFAQQVLQRIQLERKAFLLVLQLIAEVLHNLLGFRGLRETTNIKESKKRGGGGTDVIKRKLKRPSKTQVAPLPSFSSMSRRWPPALPSRRHLARHPGRRGVRAEPVLGAWDRRSSACLPREAFALVAYQCQAHSARQRCAAGPGRPTDHEAVANDQSGAPSERLGGRGAEPRLLRLLLRSSSVDADVLT
eukprot:scaffold576_cov260-Pinguiococcus_pyrenoidosus.AAC.16